MMKDTMTSVYFCVIILLSVSIVTGMSFAQAEEDPELLFNQAKELLINGQYKEAITIYDEILEMAPSNISTLKMKGIAQSNLDDHSQSLKQFFKVLQHRPNDVLSLTGMGIGLGNLGEYQESSAYFKKALKQKPNSTIIKNYDNFISSVISKYPYIPTEKPKSVESANITTIPKWVKNSAGWWSEGIIKDKEFISTMSYLIENKIIEISNVEVHDGSDNIPKWVKNSAGWWSEGDIGDDSFIQGIQYMMENGIITVSIQDKTQKTQDELDYEFYLFEKYLRDISNSISVEKRYIEYPNPSRDVIKKFLRDYVKWNFEEEAKNASEKFPDPTYEIIDGAYVIHYKVFINDQPTGLPLNHASTLRNSFLFWEEHELNIDSQKAKMKFEVTNIRHDANVWITWVVRDIGEGVLGHAHLGKGIVEVTLGDHNCDGSFQLYDVKSVETIMTHELGHSIGLQHTEDQNNIMYPSLTPSYAYCLLG